MARHLARLAWRSPDGFALLEVLLVTTLLVSLAGLAVPLTAHVTDESRARAAASHLAARLRQARLHAVTARAATALVFDQDDGRWLVRRCLDGNGNGVRRAEIDDGRDRCDPAVGIAERYPGVALQLATETPDLDNGTGNPAGVRFGRGSMASCTPAGHCTPGSLYVQGERGSQYAVRVSGVTGRARLYRFERGAREWTAD